MVQINAIYFKGSWQDAFKKEDTRVDSVFHASGEDVPCAHMRRSGRMSLAVRDVGWIAFLHATASGISAVTPIGSVHRKSVA